MAVFKKQTVNWMDYYVSGRHKRERIGPEKRLAERGARSCCRTGVTTGVTVVRTCDAY
jgi:hypothetical protein